MVLFVLTVSGCSGVSPPATTIFLIFLVFEGLLFGIFTAIMFGSQLTAICSDETVSHITFVRIISFMIFLCV